MRQTKKELSHYRRLAQAGATFKREGTKLDGTPTVLLVKVIAPTDANNRVCIQRLGYGAHKPYFIELKTLADSYELVRNTPTQAENEDPFHEL